MNLNEPVLVTKLAEMIGARVVGNDSLMIGSINEMHKVKEGSLTFADHEKYVTRAVYSAASAVIVSSLIECPLGKALLVHERPFDAYNALAKHFAPFAPLVQPISDSAVIGKGTVIEPNVIIGHHVRIGKNCYIRAGVFIGSGTVIGDNVIIHANTAIGNDAFYFQKKGRGYERWHSIGHVVIHDDVEIGAGCTIDRGVSGETIIGNGTKLDNLVHVGHGVVIGKHCLIAAQVGIAGKTKIQDGVILFGQVGVSKDLVIGENAVVLAQSGVSKSLPGGKTYFGSPAAENRERLRELAALRRLPELLHDWDLHEGRKTQQDDED